ncbi:MAG: hypothetical protein JOY99_03905 [Sphingomonadaceae bacterium]|nr:hypothetical protein [Sphingomonadaceae bacterium]
MATTVQTARGSGIAELLFALADGEGSATHPYVAALCAASAAPRDLADAIHALGMLHGRFPGVIDYAAERNPRRIAAEWLEASAAGFSRERGLLTKLVVASGPLPSTPGQAESEAAVANQHHALAMLAQSDRTGCALGAALAFMLDWRAIRRVLDAAAHRLSIPAPAMMLPLDEETREVATTLSGEPAVERAIAFGAQQVLVQHRGLWDLLETRRAARRDTA